MKVRIFEHDPVAQHQGTKPREIETDTVRIQVDDDVEFFVRVNAHGELDVQLVSTLRSALAIRPEVSNVVRLAAVRTEKPLKS